MKMISYIIPLVITLAGLWIPINALNNKTNLGRTFFTDEQRIKVRFYNYVSFSLIMSFAIAYFAFVIKVNSRGDFGTSEITSAIVLGVSYFIIFILITPPLIKWVDNFFIKTHIKYKVVLPNEIGAVYIIRMHDKDTCICSKDPNAEASQNSEYTLISMQEILGKSLLEEKIAKPPRTFYSKFFDL